MKKLVLGIAIVVSVFTLVFAGSVQAANIPAKINYHGYLKTEGAQFNGTGYFKFAITNDADNPTISYWTNDGSSSAAGAEPSEAVSIEVRNGVFNVALGDNGLTNMAAIDPAVFQDAARTYLRVWFSDGTGFEWLGPDTQLVSVPYAYQAYEAETVQGLDTASLVDVNNTQTITNKTLSDSKIDGSKNTIENISGKAIKLDGASLEATDTGLRTKIDSAGGLDSNAAGLKVKLAADSGLEVTAQGIKVLNKSYDLVVATPQEGDTGLIAAACNSAGEDQAIFIPNGIYTETSDIVLKSGQKLIGASRQGVIINFADGDYQLKAAGSDSFQDGTILVTKGSVDAQYTGAGTLPALAKAFVVIEGFPYPINSIDSGNNTIELETKYQGKDLATMDWMLAAFVSGIELRNLTVMGQKPSLAKGVIQLNLAINCIMDNIMITGNSANNSVAIKLENCFNCKVSNADLCSNFYGILFMSGGKHCVDGVSIYNNRFGLYLYEANANDINDVKVNYHSSNGISLERSRGNKFSNVTASSNHLAAIKLDGCFENQFSNVELVNNGTGVLFQTAESSYNYFSNIIIMPNGNAGITDLAGNTNNNYVNVYCDSDFNIMGSQTTVSASSFREIKITNVGNRISVTKAEQVVEQDAADYNIVVGCYLNTSPWITLIGGNSKEDCNVKFSLML